MVENIDTNPKVDQIIDKTNVENTIQINTNSNIPAYNLRARKKLTSSFL